MKLVKTLFLGCLAVAAAGTIFFLGRAYVEARLPGMFKSFVQGEIVDAQQVLADEMQRRFKILDEQNQNIAQALVQVTKNMAEIENKIPETVKKEIENTGAQPTAVGEITGRSGFYRELAGVADHVYGEPEDENYQISFKSYRGTGEQRITQGWIMYYPNRVRSDGGRGLVKRIAVPLELDAKIVEAEQKTGQTARYVELWARSPNDRETKERRLPLKIEKAEWIEKLVSGNQLFFWNPSLHLGGAYIFGENEVGIIGDIGVITYGRTKEDTLWRFLSLGAVYADDTVHPALSVVDYNWARLVPVLKHGYMGAGCYLSDDGVRPYFKLSVEF